jgi:tetratricopeptide (TPR) repeat protein
MRVRLDGPILALVFILGLGSVVPGVQQPLTDLLARAQALVDRAEYAKLRELADEIITAYPRSSDAYRFRGIAKRGLKDVQGALPDYDRAIGLDPSNVRAWRGRGQTKQTAGDLAGALADLDKAIALAPSDSGSYDVRGQIKSDLKDHKGAVADATRSIELNPDVSNSWVWRGYYRDDLGDVQGAVEDCTRAIAIDPRNGAAWFNRGDARRKLAQFPGALGDYQKAIELEYDLPNAYYGRARTNEDAGAFEAAVEDARQCLTLAPDHERAREFLARLRDKAKATPIGTSPTSPPAGPAGPREVVPASFGIVTTARSGLVSGAPDDPARDPTGDVLWKPRAAGAVRMPTIPPIDIPPTLEFGSLSMSLYTWAVTSAKEGMRVIIGPMTPDEEARFEAKWAPYYDAPTLEVVGYLNDLNPLLVRFLQARSGFVLCAQDASKATYEGVALSEQGRHDVADIAMEAARTYKGWMDAYEAAMRLALEDIEKLGPMPNPYAARRTRAKRLQDEINRLAPATQPARSAGAGEYFVLVKVDRLFGKPPGQNDTINISEGVVAASSVGRLSGDATMSISGSARWTPFPRIIQALNNDSPPIIALSATTTLALNNISNERAAVLGLLDRGTSISIASTEFGSSGDVYAAVDSSGRRPTGQAGCNLLEALHRLGSSGPSDERVLFLNVLTQPSRGAFVYHYRKAALTSDQAAEIAAKGAAEVTSLGGAQQETERVGAENAAKAARVQFLLDSRRMFEAERARAREDLNAAPVNDPARKELEMRFLYADAQGQATEDAIAYAQTGQWVRTRTLYDDYDFSRMNELGRLEAARIAGPVKSMKATEAQIQLAPEFMRLSLRNELRKGITSDMMRGRNPEGLRALATSIGKQVQDYWVKQAGRESFKGQVAGFAEEGTSIAAGTLIVGAGSVYVAGLGATGAALWAADTLLGAAYGGASGYVEGGPEEAARKSLEWAGLLGFSASAAIQSYGEGVSGSAALGAAARAVVFAKTLEFAGAFVGGFFARPTVKETFELARFNQEVEWGKALVGRFERAQAAATMAWGFGATRGPTLTRIERELSEVTAAVNGSWHAKALLKYGGNEALGLAFIRRVDGLYDEVMPDFLFNLRAMGYRSDRMGFRPVRNPSSACSVGMDLDLAITQLDPVITKGGTRVSMSTLNEDAQRAYNRAYFQRTGYSAEQSLINVTSRAHGEAFTWRMRQCPLPVEALTGWDRQRAGEVLVTKVFGTPLPGFTEAAEASRALEKELRLRVLPDLRGMAAVALRSGDRAQARRLSDSVVYWEGIQSRTAIIAQGETDAYRIWGMMQDVTAITGGKDVFELARTLSAYWPSLAKWR